MKTCQRSRLLSLQLYSLFLLVALVGHAQGLYWNRIATFLSCYQDDPTCNSDNTTNAEIVDVTPDGNLAVYTDAAGRVGYFDMSDPTNPRPAGVTPVDGEPTSTAVVPSGDYAVVVVDTSPDYVNASGVMHLIDLASKEIIDTWDVGGQPDSVAISADSQYIVIVVENERDEDFNDGALPQMPPGLVWVVDTMNDYNDRAGWVFSSVNITGLDGSLYSEDPEPEFVSINAMNEAVITLQENNAIVIIDLATASVLESFSAGSISLQDVDVITDSVIDQSGNTTDVLREPDSVAWIGNDHFVTADEGDLDGGSRTITLFNRDGTVVWSSESQLEHLSVQYGLYPESRADSKGTEPEGITYFTASDGMGYVVALLERMGTVVVYSVDPANVAAGLTFLQVLPTLYRPEGVKKVPGKDMFVVSCEEDSREDKFRAGVVIYELQNVAKPEFPFIISETLPSGKPIPWSALSGLASSNPPGFPVGTTAGDSTMLYSIEDSYFKKSRFFKIDASEKPAKIIAATHILDTNDLLKDAFPPEDFNDYVLVNDDNTVNMDSEGVAVSYHAGKIWIVNEGSGTVGDDGNPIESQNFIVKVDAESGDIEELVTLPDEVNAIQVRFGFEGVAEEGDYLVVIIQRAWGNETDPRVGIYNTETKEWKFVFYPLDEVQSQNGGWVGLSDISPLGGSRFMVLERDDQGGPDAAIKKLYAIDLDCFAVEDGATLNKTLVYDLIPKIRTLYGWTFEKMEGLAISMDGMVWVSNDNDGVDDNSGEQVLLQVFLPVETLAIASDCQSLNSTDPEDATEDTSAGIVSSFLMWTICLVVGGLTFYL